MFAFFCYQCTLGIASSGNTLTVSREQMFKVKKILLFYCM